MCKIDYVSGIFYFLCILGMQFLSKLKASWRTPCEATSVANSIIFRRVTVSSRSISLWVPLYFGWPHSLTARDERFLVEVSIWLNSKVFENVWTNLASIARNPFYKVSYAAVCSFIYAKSMAALRSSANETWRGEWETSRPSYTRTRSWQTVLVTLSYQMIQLVRHFIALFSDKISDIRFDERGGRWGRQTSGHRCRRSNRNSR